MDLEEISITDAETSGVNIKLRRGKRLIEVDVRPGFWHAYDAFGLGIGNLAEIRVRPDLREAALQRYLAGLAKFESGDGVGAAGLWTQMALDEAFARRDPEGVAWLFLRIGTTLTHAKRFQEAQDALDAALAHARERKMNSAIVQAWYAKAVGYRYGGGKPGGFEQACNEVIRIASVGDVSILWAARALSLKGWSAYQDRGKPAEAAEFFRQALAIVTREAPNSVGAESYASALGASETALHDLASAEHHLGYAVATCERLLPRRDCFAERMNLGNLLYERGDLAGAEDAFREDLAVANEYEPGGTLEAFSAGNLGMVLLRRGDLETAERYARRDLEIEEAQGPSGTSDTAEALNNLGEITAARGDLAASESCYLKALDINRRFHPGSLDEAVCLNSLGRLSLRRGKFEEARSHFQSSLELTSKLAPGSLADADAYHGLGDAAYATRDFSQAATRYARALQIRESLAAESFVCADSRYGLALAYRALGRDNEAAPLLMAALDALESQSARLGGPEEARQLFEARYVDIYHDAVDTLASVGRPGDAVRVLERSRARSLLVLLANRDLAFRIDVPPELERERRDANREFDRIQDEMHGLSPGRDAQQLSELQSQLGAIRERQRAVRDQIQRQSPRYADLRFPSPFGAEESQKALDPETVLLAYSVGRDRTLLFVLSSSPGARDRFAVVPIPVGDGALRHPIEMLHGYLESSRLSAQWIERSRAMYDTLIKPAEPFIAAGKRLLILPDGPLHTLPWSSLIRGVRNGLPQYLVEWKPIDTVVSTTVYAELKKSRKADATPVIEIAAFGDPNYPKLPDKKTSVTRAGEQAANSQPIDELSEIGDPQLRTVARGGFRFQALPESRKEVDQIASLYAPKSIAYLGADATEERAKAIGKDVPIIHFATHAIINERFPLDSALVFTIPEHPKAGQDNGLLQAWEIFEQMRIDADLVTLSACDSGLGKEMGGEGLIGLVRAFQYAGARSVLASLWKVEDKATAELMKRFYTYLKGGMTKDEALRHAQIDLIHSKEYSNPRDWAAFQLNGDWK